MGARRLSESHAVESNISSNHQFYSLPSAWTAVHDFQFGYKAIDDARYIMAYCDGSDVNGLGRLVLLGGLLLLPVAFVINLLTFLKSPQVKRKLHTANVIVGIIILMSILVSWGGLLVEEIHCLQGIRCDWSNQYRVLKM